MLTKKNADLFASYRLLKTLFDCLSCTVWNFTIDFAQVLKQQYNSYYDSLNFKNLNNNFSSTVQIVHLIGTYNRCNRMVYYRIKRNKKNSI